MAVVESPLDEDAAGADGFRIFGDERTLLGRRRHWQQQRDRCRNERMSHQNCRVLSTSTVTGPSLTSSTCIIAWNSPVATGTLAACNSLTTASYKARANSGGVASSNEGRRLLRMSP